ncbi:MAG: 6-carboxytetrahydropterin synthase [Myxococcota bacterium]
MHTISIRHNFETAHRLSSPNAPTKCQSIHGHSWWVELTIEGSQLDDNGMLIEFGALKRAWRHFLDQHLDHHLAVRQGDPVVAALREVMPDMRILELPFDPTTEALAHWLYQRAAAMVHDLNPSLRVQRIHIQETAVNAASYAPPAASVSRGEAPLT